MCGREIMLADFTFMPQTATAKSRKAPRIYIHFSLVSREIFTLTDVFSRKCISTTGLIAYPTRLLLTIIQIYDGMGYGLPVREFPQPLHSYLSATSGSTFVARRAGT
jgi:hypothetical protein